MTQLDSSSLRADWRVYLGSTLLFVYIVLSTPIVGVLILSCFWTSFKVRDFFAEQWIRSLLFMVKILCRLDYQVEGLEHIPPDRAVIVISNHQSAWETVALRLLIKPQAPVLKKSLLQIPFGGWALASLKPIAIDRQNQKQALKMLMDQGIARLQEGVSVMIFPEGTRVAPNDTKKFNSGGAMLAQKSGFPILPLAHNAGEFWPRNSFLKYPGTIRVKIGALITVEDKKSKELMDEVEHWIVQAKQDIARLS
jgi:1-acyl-sn-glycerol-3-phosphate acyltransferase